MFPSLPRKLSPLARWFSPSRACALAGLSLIGLLANVLPLASAQASTCPTASVSQPFLKWSDANYYTLVPGGDFEGSLTGWTLTGGAQPLSGSEPYAATGELGKYSLALPLNATAKSPYVCVSGVDRAFRFFVKNEGTSATVKVTVVYNSLLGLVLGSSDTLEVKGGWQPSPSFHTGAALASVLSLSGTAQMALRFTTVSGSARIDDVYLDPRMR